MRLIVRDLTYLAYLLVVALVFALAWGSPFIEAGSAGAPNQAQLPQTHR
jgi:hypothetical protein